MEAPCNWPISYAGCGGADPLEPPEPLLSLPEGRDLFEEMAATYLWRWTGMALGLCEVTIRPCRVDCNQGLSTFSGSGPGAGGAPFHPVIIGGLWFNVGCGRCGDLCSCGGGVESVTLPGPVHSITSINIDGTDLPSGSYRVDNRRFLIRTDGGAWPLCNNLALDAGETGTWTVTYERGVPVPVGGQIAAGVLAVELAKASCNDSSCRLPQRVQTVSRQGVTIAMLDSFDDVDTGHTGIWIIDSWLASVSKPPQRSRVYSPDVPRRSTRTTSP